jgi:hypothetical protein
VRQLHFCRRQGPNQKESSCGYCELLGGDRVVRPPILDVYPWRIFSHFFAISVFIQISEELGVKFHQDTSPISMAVWRSGPRASETSAHGRFASAEPNGCFFPLLPFLHFMHGIIQTHVGLWLNTPQLNVRTYWLKLHFRTLCSINVL